MDRGRFARVLALLSLVVGACAEPAGVSSTSHDLLAASPPADPNGGESIYESPRVFDRRGDLASVEEHGRLTSGAWQRVARPWTHRDEAQVYHEQAWQRALDDGRSLHGYRVVRTQVARRAVRAPAPPAL